MRKTVVLLFTLFTGTLLYSQQKDFEGIVVYKVETTSKTEGVSNQSMRRSLLLGGSTVTFIKQGTFKVTSGFSDTYYLSPKRRLYYKFNNIDTLFYLNYASDSTLVNKVIKGTEEKKIAGLDCKLLTVEMPSMSKKYFYAPALYSNPEYNKNNKLGRYDVYVKETSSVWLSAVEETEAYTLTQNCIRLQPMPVADTLFKLPTLPQKEFSYASVTTAPQFSAQGGWIGFLQKNLNADLGSKYIKLPRSQNTAMQTAIVAFIITDKGRIVSPQVVKP